MRCARGTQPLWHPCGTPKRHPRLIHFAVPGSPEMGVIKPKALLPFSVESVGTYSCHGVEPGIRQGETSAKINQDRGCVCFPFGSDSATKTMALMCVFDGHGASPQPLCTACVTRASRCTVALRAFCLCTAGHPLPTRPRVFSGPAGAQGDKVSHYVMNEVQKKLEDHPTLESNPEKAMKDVFIDVDNALRKDPSIDAELSGTTAVVCLFVLEATGLVIYTANAGDSRATIGQNRVAGQAMKSHNLSEDQKPDTPLEMKRIQKAGGHVSPPEEEWGGPARVWIDANMTLPGLAMARSIGDHLVKTVGVIPDPEVTKYAVKPGDEFLVRRHI